MASSSAAMVESLLSSLTLEQCELLCKMSCLPIHEQAMLGPELISRAQAGVPVDWRNACQSPKRKRADMDAPALTKLDNGTGPAFEAIGERAVQHRYITQPALDAIRERINCLPAAEQEDALVCAMRRFCACTQPMSSVVLSGHALEGYHARLVGCAPPGGTPEVYNVAVMVAGDGGGTCMTSSDGGGKPLLIQVEPKHFRPAPMERDARDDMHEVIPADHEAEAWFAEKVLVSEMMFRAEAGQGASFGPGRPV